MNRRAAMEFGLALYRNDICFIFLLYFPVLLMVLAAEQTMRK
jgi:hypothetical protein